MNEGRPGLPLRAGVSASAVVVSRQEAQQHITLLTFLSQRFPHVSEVAWQQRIVRGDVCSDEGWALTADSRCIEGQRIFYWRDAGEEVPVPFEARIVFMNDELLIADKPHFLPVVPSGRYVTETLLARMKRTTGISTLVPVHRIDRDTAGLVMFSLNPRTRGVYQALFRERRITKRYEAIAAHRPELKLPLRHACRLEAAAHFMQMRVSESGEVNCITEIQLLEQRSAMARYALTPHTGKRHQLRVVMNALGMPILNDGLYPVLTPEREADDFSKPLQLLAKSLSFVDPITKTELEFHTDFKLENGN